MKSYKDNLTERSNREIRELKEKIEELEQGELDRVKLDKLCVEIGYYEEQALSNEYQD